MKEESPRVGAENIGHPAARVSRILRAAGQVSGFAGHDGNACAVRGGVGIPSRAEAPCVMRGDVHSIVHLLQQLISNAGLRDGQTAGISGQSRA